MEWGKVASPKQALSERQMQACDWLKPILLAKMNSKAFFELRPSFFDLTTRVCRPSVCVK
jgi:hypothetical protein